MYRTKNADNTRSLTLDFEYFAKKKIATTSILVVQKEEMIKNVNLTTRHFCTIFYNNLTLNF